MDQAAANQLKNIEARTGKSLDELGAMIRESGLAKHGEIRKMLIDKLGMGYGDANTLVHHVLRSDGARASEGMSGDEVLATIYSGAKAHLRPIHDRIMAEVSQFGPFEVAPKKGYVSLRRKKQFATIGPATNSRVEVGLNMKGVESTGRLAQLPAGGMCNYKVRITEAGEVDGELIGWIKLAYEGAG